MFSLITKDMMNMKKTWEDLFVTIYKIFVIVVLRYQRRWNFRNKNCQWDHVFHQIHTKWDSSVEDLITLVIPINRSLGFVVPIENISQFSANQKQKLQTAAILITGSRRNESFFREHHIHFYQLTNHLPL